MGILFLSCFFAEKAVIQKDNGRTAYKIVTVYPGKKE